MSDHELEFDIVPDYAAANAAFLEARRLKRITQEMLAERLGVSQATIARRESGVRMPSAEDLFATAHALGVDLAFVPREFACCPHCGRGA